jgi:hypothetical protein
VIVVLQLTLYRFYVNANLMYIFGLYLSFCIDISFPFIKSIHTIKSDYKSNTILKIFSFYLTIEPCVSLPRANDVNKLERSKKKNFV